ncbi:related to Protein EAR1 [Saccharomycodes ludwigii]|uniref:Related to Protein EAR1 n=1 Tax=Saccharomycodes ludwigii TaxID=36035 RepID=A0A376B783_9ASCO|nr:hypothetical protein SCDLUD_002698 [Saccharomycodes ludwigii]KAH3901212.1 hypothetical protein SCDLUD_002698 [Saccharomycodes ludwigii]SSD60566.1 related to Protein EAR1 [Saccharomycodes ludwigii]
MLLKQLLFLCILQKFVRGFPILKRTDDSVAFGFPVNLLSPNQSPDYLLFVNDEVNIKNNNTGDDDNIFDFSIFLFFSFGIMLISYALLAIIYIIVKFIVHKVFQKKISLFGRRIGRGGILTDLESNVSTNNHEANTRSMNNSSNNHSSNRYDLSVYLDDEDDIQANLETLSSEEQFYYKQGEEYVKQNPPLLIPNTNRLNSQDGSSVVEDPIMTEQALQYIEEEGAHAWEFQADPNLPCDTVIVENKTYLTFLNYHYDASIMTSLPIPYQNRVYYYECKIYEIFPSENVSNNDLESDIISIGFATNPYPYFRLPGRHHHSVAYDSNGSRRFNNSFELTENLKHLLPKCEKGDVMGIGYRTRSGTVFFTHNGKKVKETEVGGHIKKWRLKYLYPIVGANFPCKLGCNFGTFGFVYIEANIKKWGFASMNGLKLAPPSYATIGEDVLLESCGEDEDETEAEDDDNDYDYLGEEYNEHADASSGGSSGSDVTRNKPSNTILRDSNNNNNNNIITSVNSTNRQRSKNQSIVTNDNVINSDSNYRFENIAPPPGFEFSTSVSQNGDSISLDYLPPNPPNYASDEDQPSVGLVRSSSDNARNRLLPDNQDQENGDANSDIDDFIIELANEDDMLLRENTLANQNV